MDERIRLLSHKAKVYRGKVTNYFSKLRVAELTLEAGDLCKGEELLITGPTTGIVRLQLSEMRLDDNAVEHAPKGSVISIPCPDRVRVNDRIYTFEERKVKQPAFQEQ